MVVINAFVWISGVLLISHGARAENAEVHVVERGETLSELAFRYLGRPVYARENGSLAWLMRMNPGIGNPDHIYPGQKLVVRDGSLRPEPPAQAMAEEIEGKRAAAPEIPSNQKFPLSPAMNRIPAENPGHRLAFMAGYRFTVLHAEDRSRGSSADLQSSRDFFARMEWSQDWSSRFSSMAVFGARNLDFQPSTNPAKTLAQTSRTLFDLAFGVESQMLENLWLRAGAAMGQEIFLAGLGTAVVGVDVLAVPRISVGVRGELLRKGTTSGGIEAAVHSLSAVSGDSISVKTGSIFGGRIYLKKETRELRVYEWHLGIQRRFQDSSLLAIQETGVEGGLRFSLPLFGGGSSP